MSVAIDLREPPSITPRRWVAYQGIIPAPYDVTLDLVTPTFPQDQLEHIIRGHATSIIAQLCQAQVLISASVISQVVAHILSLTTGMRSPRALKIPQSDDFARVLLGHVPRDEFLDDLGIFSYAFGLGFLLDLDWRWRC